MQHKTTGCQSLSYINWMMETLIVLSAVKCGFSPSNDLISVLNSQEHCRKMITNSQRNKAPFTVFNLTINGNSQKNKDKPYNKNPFCFRLHLTAIEKSVYKRKRHVASIAKCPFKCGTHIQGHTEYPVIKQGVE